MKIYVLNSNIMRHRVIIGHSCIPLTNVRQPIDNDNGRQCTWCNLTSVNKGFDVENLIEYTDQGTLMYSHYQ
jgi:hypothetical protein